MANKKNAADAPGQTPAGEPDWRRFPGLEHFFGSEEAATALLGKIEKSCRRLDELTRTGSSAEQARARAALAAYGRTLDLLHQIRERREQAMAAANSR